MLLWFCPATSECLIVRVLQDMLPLYPMFVMRARIEVHFFLGFVWSISVFLSDVIPNFALIWSCLCYCHLISFKPWTISNWRSLISYRGQSAISLLDYCFSSVHLLYFFTSTNHFVDCIILLAQYIFFHQALQSFIVIYHGDMIDNSNYENQVVVALVNSY